MAAFEDLSIAGAGGVLSEAMAPTAPKLTPAQEEANWRKENEAAYKAACENERCTCTPTRAEMLLMERFHRGSRF